MAPPKEKVADAAPQSGEEDAVEAAAGVKRPASANGESGTAKKAAPDAKQTFKGSCHCGKIQYTADFDPKDLQGNKCNCTWCQKRNLVNVEIKGAYSDFKLIKPKSKDDVADYAPETEATKSGMADGHRYFCANCGVHVWGEGWYEFGGEKHNFFSVNLATIDQPQDGIDLSETKIKYCDGLNNNWFAGLKDEPWSGGLP